LVYRAIDPRGRVFDTYPENAPGAIESSEVFSALPRLYALPGDWVKIDPWKVSGTAGNQGTSSVTFTNRSERPLDARIASQRAPAGAKLSAPSTVTTVAPGGTVSWPISFAATPGQTVDLAYFRVLITARGAAGSGMATETYEANFNVPPPAAQ
jgi:hypothetical protein